MRAAAQFARGADVEHAHLVAVFFAEQRHRAVFDSIVELHDLRRSRRIGKDLRVNDHLDLPHFILTHR